MSGLVPLPLPHAVGTVDIALWDIAGKAAGLPVHRLLGTCRDRIPAYFSTAHHQTAAEYADEAVYWREQGWRGYKLHPPRGPWLPPGQSPPVGFDIEACAAVRAAVGDDMTLMLDSSWSYSYPDALRVGQAIQDLGYFWYEDPLPDHDIHGYARLARHLQHPAARDRDHPRRPDRAAAVDHQRRDRLPARRRGHQGRHHRADEDRAPGRGVRHELRGARLLQRAQQRRRPARDDGHRQLRLARGPGLQPVRRPQPRATSATA